MDAWDAKLKFWIYNKLDRTGYDAWHVHSDVWQMDLAECGGALMSFKGGVAAVELLPGEAVAIPPGFTHAYLYDGEYGNWSMKFSLKGFLGEAAPFKLSAKGVDAVLLEAIARVFGESYRREDIRGKCVFGSERFDGATAVESLLSCVMRRRFEAESASEGELLVDHVKTMLMERRGGSLKAEEAAAALGYSGSHFNVLMKAQSGLSAKEAIDKERGRIAMELLRYSDMNVNEAADYMGFPDAFCFNKFFRRVNGVSPGRFKRKA